MKLKEPFFAVIGGLLFLANHLAQAQQRPPIPKNSNQRYIYMRGDTVFEKRADGVEVPLLPQQAYQRHIDSLKAELFLYKPKPRCMLVELDTVDNTMVYREKTWHVKVSNLYDDSLWVTNEIFVSAHRRNSKIATSNFTLEVIPQNDGLRFDADSIIIRDKAKVQEVGLVTDSIKWVPAGGTIIFDDIDECREHDWAYEAPRKAYFGYHEGSKMLFGDGYIRMRCDQVNPDGKHCNEHQSATREKICRKCLRSEIEREWWFQHFVAPPKSEFEILKEKQMEKR